MKKSYSDEEVTGSLISRFAREAGNRVVFRVARFVMARPGHRYFALSMLKRFPSLKGKIRSVVTGRHFPATDIPISSDRGESNFFVDISRLAGADGKSGIPRVTRSILFSLMKDPPEGFRVVPVFATKRRPGYFVLDGLNVNPEKENGLSFVFPEVKRPIRFSSGDIFLCLDFHPLLINVQQYYLSEIQKAGVYVYSLVHDLLPLQMPDKFPHGLKEIHENWLRTILRFSGALCVSSKVAEDLRQWILKEEPQKSASFKIGWFHLGADFENFPALSGSASCQPCFPDAVHSKPFFLMVGTVEPRKGYSQVLEAFKILWGKGENLSLVIAGRQGWLVEGLVKKIRNHEESGKRLFWFEDLNDDQLLELYKGCTALLMASEGEGFGLPLVEAARLGVPLIARDLPVIREVTGGHAFFFKGDTPEELADPLKEWLALYREGMKPEPDGVPWLTWAQSTRSAFEVIQDLKESGSV